MNLIILASGLGSRFQNIGQTIPKPLIEFQGKPLFWWAAMSALSSHAFKNISFALLESHIQEFSIDKIVLSYFPDATIETIKKVTKGAAETATIACSNLNPNNPVGFIDCDLSFAFHNDRAIEDFLKNGAECALCLFHSYEKKYSFARLNESGKVIGTVEKDAVSNQAIAGLYLFRSVEAYKLNYEKYIKTCHYNELFLSGIFNEVISGGGEIARIQIEDHLSLGTPEDIKRASLANYKPKWWMDLDEN
jgi:dTDP-glucose pyrophosphorylase